MHPPPPAWERGLKISEKSLLWVRGSGGSENLILVGVGVEGGGGVRNFEVKIKTA